MTKAQIHKPRLFFYILVCAVLYSGISPGAGEEKAKAEYKKSAGPFEVEVALWDWYDEARDRKVPVKVYYPKKGEGSHPVILLSHGLGGSREGYAYLGKHWASHGYVACHLQHLGSDSAVWKGKVRIMEAMKRAAADPRNALNRAKDVSFTLDRLTKMNHEDGALKERLDLDRIGMVGHSFGAHTTLMAAGVVVPGILGKGRSYGDPRIKAAIPMSGPVPKRRNKLDKVYGSIKVPCFHMTGTLDESPIGDTGPEDRRVPFDHISGSDQYLVTFQGGDHMIFSGGRRILGAGRNDAFILDMIRMGTTAFWDAYLKGEKKALSWLTEGGFKAALDTHGVFEQKIIEKNAESQKEEKHQ